MCKVKIRITPVGDEVENKLVVTDDKRWEKSDSFVSLNTSGSPTCTYMNKL